MKFDDIEAICAGRFPKPLSTVWTDSGFIYASSPVKVWGDTVLGIADTNMNRRTASEEGDAKL
jgi:hypothetical protein